MCVCVTCTWVFPDLQGGRREDRGPSRFGFGVRVGREGRQLGPCQMTVTNHPRGPIFSSNAMYTFIGASLHGNSTNSRSKPTLLIAERETVLKVALARGRGRMCCAGSTYISLIFERRCLLLHESLHANLLVLRGKGRVEDSTLTSCGHRRMRWLLSVGDGSGLPSPARPHLKFESLR